MSRFSLALTLAAAAAVLVAAPRHVPAAPPPPPPPPVSAADQTALAGPWKGTWTGHNYRYDAVMALVIEPDGSVGGSINWTLRASPNPAGAKMIGQSGVENVRGTYHPDSAMLVLEGYGKADPNGILELDKYLLVVSPTRQTMGGITEDHGNWSGQFFLSR